MFLADQSGVSPEWVMERMACLPAECREQHFILLTSGSTGKPKLVVGTRQRAESLARTLHELQASEPVDETVCLLPLTYCYAFVNQWLWSRQFNRRLVVTEGLAQPGRLKEALATSRNAMICLVGAQVPLLTRYFQEDVFPGVIRVHFAGGRYPQERLDEVRRLFPNAEIFNNYGCAEAMPRLTLRRAEDAPLASHIGWPLPGVEMRADETDRLLFRSAYGAVAMIDDVGFTAIGPETWVPTGDLGRRLENGQWELLGRANEVFKRYGEKISLPQILTLVRANWHGLADCYRESDPQGEAGYVLVLSPAPSADQVRDILRKLSQTLPRTHWPLRVEGVANLPMLANGKIDRQQLAGRPDSTILWRQRI